MGASFHDVQFPPDISLGATGGPGFHTTVLTLASGAEKRNIDWSMARATYNVAHGLKTQAQLDALIAFFYARRGQAYGFRFKDWTDFNLWSGTGPLPVIFVTNGQSVGIRLNKVYADVAGTYTRPILKPINGTLNFLLDGVPIVGVMADEATGLVWMTPDISGTTGKVITGTCEFDVPVRFASDSMQVSVTDIDNFSWPAIDVIEVRDV